MITREDAQRFFSQDKVWVWNDDKSTAHEGEPGSVDIKTEVPWMIYIKAGPIWGRNFSLEDPRPKREFEKGALYPVLFQGDTRFYIARYNKTHGMLFLGTNEKYKISDFSFIGDKLSPKLWGDRK